MANGHNKRKSYSRKERYGPRRKERTNVSLRQDDDQASVVYVDDCSTRVNQGDDLDLVDSSTDQIGVSDIDAEGRRSVDHACRPADDVLDVENSSTNKMDVSDISVEGRRIVDISFFLQQLHDKFDNHNIASSCPFSELKLVKSLDRGLRTQLHFVCRMCNYAFNVWTDPGHQNILGINESAVCGTITSGTGHSTLQEQLAAMSVPCMSAPTYLRYRNKVSDNFHEVAEAERIRAAAMEREIAISKGHVVDGVPYISVVADGCWSKRSYAGGKHDALSGAAMIFGHSTKLALFVGVRNKYRAINARAESQNKEPTPHVCYENWGRDRPSTAMKTDIIAEGFRTSVESNGLIYKTLIADGDSSVYQSIRDSNPYCQLNVHVDKLECCNHLYRNFCSKCRMASIMRLTTPPLKGVLTVLQFRQFVCSSGFKIRRLIETARDLRNTETASEYEKVTLLCKDIFTIFAHVYGDHTDCHTLPFDCTPEPNGKNVLAELHRTGLYTPVYEAVRHLSSHARSLLHNVNNNVAESCNSIVNKLNSGKRINHCMRNSYEMRCYGAVVQSNTQSVLSKLHNLANVQVPATVVKMERHRRNQNHLTRLYRSKQRNTRPSNFHGVDKDYGPLARKPDMDKDVFDVLAAQHIEKLKSWQSNRTKIERDTVLQSDSGLWHQLRTDIITASKFGQICRMLPTTSCGNMVTKIRYPKVIDTAATNFGIANEANAVRDLQLRLGETIDPCGLFIDEEIPYLGASPDGLIDDDGVVEIKCPFSAQDADLDQVIEEKPNLRHIFDKKNKNILNKTHAYYYQVQGQLHVTKRDYCIFALWTSTDLKVVEVLRDDSFWESKMKPFLCRFYMECLLPEIVEGRRNRSMQIRDPKYNIDAQAAALRKKNARCVTNDSIAGNCRVDLVQEIPEERRPVSLIAEDLVNHGCSTSAKANAMADWIVIENDAEIEASREATELLEIVRRNVSVEEVEANVLSTSNLLTDSSIDLLQNVLGENSGFTCHPASYTAYYSCIKPCSPLQRDIQIIGGNACRHWCCVYYDTDTLNVYDSLLRAEYERFSEEEKRYVSKRYPHLSIEKFVFQPVTKQPDSVSCGVYSAAYATTVALNSEPSRQTYSQDAKAMRTHLMTILRSRTLIPFPCE